MTDTSQTILRFLSGDNEAFTLLVQEWQGRVYNLAWRFTGNREDAQDVVQETFLAVFRSLRGLRDPSSFPTWLYRIALNQCRARWRSRSPELSLDEPVHGVDGEEGTLPQVAAAGTDFAGRLEARDLICRALMSASEDHRTAIILKEYVGLSLEEVARVMECPLSTAKSRLYHGLRGVQQSLKKLGA
jgi:RNA polymerase sigma-70 factor (ECF subfamily)